LLAIDPGFERQGVLTLSVSLPRSSYPDDPQKIAFFEQALERLAALPGVRRAGAVSVVPMGGMGSATSFHPLDRERPAPGEEPVADIRMVAGDFFAALGIPVLEGRTFSSLDRRGALPRSVIVGEQLARRLWPGASALGKELSISWGEDEACVVVGVVKEVREVALDTEPRGTIYWPLEQVTQGAMSFVLRTEGDPRALAEVARSAVWEIDPDLPIFDVRPLDLVLRDTLGRRRWVTVTLLAFAVVSLLLAALGIYGVMSSSVTERTREIALRMALGATPQAIRERILLEALQLVAVAGALGVVAALAAARLLRSLLFQVRPADPATVLLVALALALVAVLAALVPALRASRVAPIAALREE
jgi:predicted permease